MPGPPRRVMARSPDIDLDIFRELYGGAGVTTIGFDPRLTSSVVARRLRQTRARVAARLAEWTEVGLLQRYDVWPNPALFGLEVATVEVRVADRLGKEPLFERLGVFDGMLGGVDFLGDWFMVQLFARSRPEMLRRAELLRGLAGVVEVVPPVFWEGLEARRPLGPLDRRIVRVLRRYPKAPLATIARHVGVSPRTITTRYGRLLDDRSVWFVPVLDFRALQVPVLSVQLALHDAGDRTRVVRALRKEYPQVLEFLRGRVGPVYPQEYASVIVLAPSAASVGEIERHARAIPGVAGVEVYTMVRMLSFPTSVDGLLAEDGTAGRGPT